MCTRRRALSWAFAAALLPAAHAQSNAFGAGLVWVYDAAALGASTGAQSERRLTGAHWVAHSLRRGVPIARHACRVAMMRLRSSLPAQPGCVAVGYALRTALGPSTHMLGHAAD
jgi:hypothetical protein